MASKKYKAPIISIEIPRIALTRICHTEMCKQVERAFSRPHYLFALEIPQGYFCSSSIHNTLLIHDIWPNPKDRQNPYSLRIQSIGHNQIHWRTVCMGSAYLAPWHIVRILYIDISKNEQTIFSRSLHFVAGKIYIN